MIYNTSQKDIVLREYGRNVQNVIEHLKSIEDKEKRTALAHVTIELMKQIAPAAKETTETTQKLWDDLFIISDFDLDVDSPFPIPEREVLFKKPQRMGYISNRIKYKHYGRNLELLVLEALKKDDPQERENAIIYIGKLMKSFYTSWNKETIDDAVILENIKSISDGKLDIDLGRVKEDNLFEKLYKSKPRKSGSQRSSQGKGKGSSNRRRRRN
jgi:hypothetical protein